MPKFALLYYKALLDRCFVKFFDDYNDLFTNQDGQYILAQNVRKSYLKNVFKKYLIEELKNILVPYDRFSPTYFLIIGSCMPKDNLLMKFKDEECCFPEKLAKVVNAETQIKYVLKEKDIRIDLLRFNDVVIEIFNDFFTADWKILKELGDRFTNVFFVQNRQLDCYSMFKVVKYIYGKTNCENLYLKHFVDKHSPLIAINELIDKSISNKVKMNTSKEFKTIVNEVKQFIDSKIVSAGQK